MGSSCKSTFYQLIYPLPACHRTFCSTSKIVCSAPALSPSPPSIVVLRHLMRGIYMMTLPAGRYGQLSGTSASKGIWLRTRHSWDESAIGSAIPSVDVSSFGGEGVCVGTSRRARYPLNKVCGEGESSSSSPSPSAASCGCLLTDAALVAATAFTRSPTPSFKSPGAYGTRFARSQRSDGRLLALAFLYSANLCAFRYE